MQNEWNNIHVDFPDEPLLRLGVDGRSRNMSICEYLQCNIAIDSFIFLDVFKFTLAGV